LLPGSDSLDDAHRDGLEADVKPPRRA